MDILTATRTRKEEITKEAAHLFRVKGYGSSSMRDIASAIGIEASSLYNHFPGKGHILLSICLQVADWYESELREVVQTQETPLEKLTRLTGFLLDLYLRERDMVESANQEWKHLPDTEKQQFYIRRKRFETDLIQLIEDGQNLGQIVSIPSRIVMLSILQTPRIIDAYQKQLPTEVEETSLLSTHLTKLILHGLVR